LRFLLFGKRKTQLNVCVCVYTLRLFSFFNFSTDIRLFLTIRTNFREWHNLTPSLRTSNQPWNGRIFSWYNSIVRKGRCVGGAMAPHPRLSASLTMLFYKRRLLPHRGPFKVRRVGLSVTKIYMTHGGTFWPGVSKKPFWLRFPKWRATGEGKDGSLCFFGRIILAESFSRTSRGRRTSRGPFFSRSEISVMLNPNAVMPTWIPFFDFVGSMCPGTGGDNKNSKKGTPVAIRKHLRGLAARLWKPHINVKFKIQAARTKPSK